MILYSEIISRDQMRAIAHDLDMQVRSEDFEGSRKRRISFTLRPVGETYRTHRPDKKVKAGYRRLWAVSYEGHRQFMARLFDLDPSARIKSWIADWNGREYFEANTSRADPHLSVDAVMSY